MKILLQAVTRLLLLLKGDTSPALLGQILGLWGLYTLEEGTRSGLGQGHSTVPWLQEDCCPSLRSLWQTLARWGC